MGDTVKEPRIATCGGCGWLAASNTTLRPDRCKHPRAPTRYAIEVASENVPPDECPLRGTP